MRKLVFCSLIAASTAILAADDAAWFLPGSFPTAGQLSFSCADRTPTVTSACVAYIQAAAESSALQTGSSQCVADVGRPEFLSALVTRFNAAGLEKGKQKLPAASVIRDLVPTLSKACAPPGAKR